MPNYLEQATITDILEKLLSNLSVFGRDIDRPEGADSRPIILNYLLSNEFIDEDRFRQAVYDRLSLLGTELLTQYLHEGTIKTYNNYAAPLIGFALQDPNVDTTGIKFGDGISLEKFTLASEGLLGSVMEQLRTENIRL